MESNVDEPSSPLPFDAEEPIADDGVILRQIQPHSDATKTIVEVNGVPRPRPS